MGARSNHACATCPTVATGEAHPLLLEHHSSDRTAAVSHLPVATEAYCSSVFLELIVDSSPDFVPPSNDFCNRF
jgi:hypothetical protein